VLLAAEAWGTPPWVVQDAPGSARWLARWGELQRLRQFVSEPKPIEDDDGDG
jgi:hypothetical protein